MHIVCVGGGPAGLYFAICAKLRNPEHRIRLFERRPEGVTFGWGFGFWNDVLTSLYANDPVTARQIEAATGLWDGIEVHIGDRPTAYLGGHGLSMARRRLLEILVARARQLGVELHFEREVTDLRHDPVFAVADLVVASDGINSGLREADRFDFGTTVDTGRNHYLWLGTEKLFGPFQYVFEPTEAGWIWMHCYYLDERRSTCVVECPPETWHGLGLDELSPSECLMALEGIFHRQLDGHRLISQVDETDTLAGLHGKQVRNARWYRDNIALLGDAAHTTHFSPGSGTRLAIGDAVALAEAVNAHGEDVPAALRAYDATRRPEIDRIQQQALGSMRFLERVPELLDAPDVDPVQFAYAISRRLGTRNERWRYYLHLATQTAHPPGRITVGPVLAAASRHPVRARPRRPQVGEHRETQGAGQGGALTGARHRERTPTAERPPPASGRGRRRVTGLPGWWRWPGRRPRTSSAGRTGRRAGAAR